MVFQLVQAALGPLALLWRHRLGIRAWASVALAASLGLLDLLLDVADLASGFFKLLPQSPGHFLRGLDSLELALEPFGSSLQLLAHLQHGVQASPAFALTRLGSFASRTLPFGPLARRAPGAGPLALRPGSRGVRPRLLFFRSAAGERADEPGCDHQGGQRFLPERPQGSHGRVSSLEGCPGQRPGG